MYKLFLMRGNSTTRMRKVKFVKKLSSLKEYLRCHSILNLEMCWIPKVMILLFETKAAFFAMECLQRTVTSHLRRLY